MKRVKVTVTASDTSLTDREAAQVKNVYRKAQALLDAFEDLPTGVIDKLGDFGVVYEDIIDYLPAFHDTAFGRDDDLDY